MAAPLRLTLVEIAQIFKEIADNDANLSQWSIGANWEPNQNYQLEYPLMFLEYPSIITSTKVTKDFSFAFLILDRTLEDAPGQRTDIELGGALKALSKTDQIADNVIASIYANESRLLGGEFTFNKVPIIEDFADRVYGWRVEVSLKAKQVLSKCDVV